jgi:hypothetical protein
MKTLYASLLALSLAALVGCTGSSTDNTSKVGGPGATGSTDRGGSILGPKENTFELDPPNLEKSITQGTSEPIVIGIDRGKNFDQDVALSFDNVPKGVSIDPAAPTIKKGDKNATINVKAAADAAVGHHEIKVVGKPGSGASASNTFKIEVKAK